MTWVVIMSALWFGIFTAISPCPLASNIAALSFISRSLTNRTAVLFAGVLYALGRSISYVFLAMIISGGLLSRSMVSELLSKYMNEFLGPVLILFGLVLLGWLGRDMGGISFNAQKLQDKAATRGLVWSLPLGALFALSFCPVSAGLFFGALLPLAVKSSSAVLVPAVYGMGTALPVIGFAFLLAFFAGLVGRAFSIMSRIELVVRYGAGSIFILTGIYYSLTHVFGVLN